MAAKETKPAVICIGAAIVDILLQPVGKHIFEAVSYPIDRIAMTIGGDAINEATIISRLGHRVLLMSRIGKDTVGNFILEACEKDNIDASGLRVDEQIETSLNVGLITADGERTFVTNRNGSLWKTNIEDVDFSRFKEARLLSLASIFNNPLLNGAALVKIFQEAKKCNLLICADMVKARVGETLDDIREALSYVDYFFPNYEEATVLTGHSDPAAIAASLLDCGVKHVILKTGKKGCFIKTADLELEIPAMPGITPIDTTGAGDNFASGFISALLDGKSVADCAKFANATASIAVEYVGATSGVRSRAQVEERLALYMQQTTA